MIKYRLAEILRMNSNFQLHSLEWRIELNLFHFNSIVCIASWKKNNSFDNKNNIYFDESSYFITFSFTFHDEPNLLDHR